MVFLVIWIVGMLPPILERFSLESPAGYIRCIFKLLCHGIPDRCPQVFERPAAVCVRCTGIYLSFFIGCSVVFPIIRNKLDTKILFPASFFFTGTMGMQWILEFTGILNVSPFLQILTGFMWGLALSQLLCLSIDGIRRGSGDS